MEMRATRIGVACMLFGLSVLQIHAMEVEEAPQVPAPAAKAPVKTSVPGALWHKLDRAIRLNNVQATLAALRALTTAWDDTGLTRKEFVGRLEKWLNAKSGESYLPKGWK